MTILIKNGTILALDPANTLIDKGFVLIENDRISSMGAGDPPPDLIDSASTIMDAKNKVVMPGIINAHTHLFQTYTRGLADNKPLFEWLKECVWPIGENMGADDAKLAGLLGCVENIRSGVTSVIDNQYIHSVPGVDDAFCQAAVETGVRYLMARGWTDMNFLPASFNETTDEIIENIGQLVSDWNFHPSGRIRVEFGPQAIAPCSKESFQKTFEKAREWGIGVHLHIAESRYEAEKNFKKNGMGEVEWLNHLGCLDSNVRLVHAIWLSDAEIDLISRLNVNVVHCPVSNMYLADGIARIPDMLKRNITVALATDGPGSNNCQDIFETMKTTALLHKISTMDANVIDPLKILRMACNGGAVVFGSPNLTGSLEIGKKADLILIDLDSPFVAPVHNIISSLVYNICSRDVDTVIVDGKVLMQDKKITVLDEARLLQECRDSLKSVMARI